MKINIGGQKGKSNGDFRDWKIVDVLPGADHVVDISTQKLPFENDSVDAIYTSHTLEHVFSDLLPFVLSEFYRVMKPNSNLRIVVPDITKAINAYINKDKKYLTNSRNPTKPDHYPPTLLGYLYGWFHSHKIVDGKRQLIGGHFNAFDQDHMNYYLGKAKFRNIQYMSFGKYSPIFDGCDFPRYKNCSIYVEAMK